MLKKLERAERNYEESQKRTAELKARLEKLRREENRNARLAASKVRSKAIASAGALVEMAGLLEADKGALLGGLLELADAFRKEPESGQIREWKGQGDDFLAEWKKPRKSPRKPPAD